MAIAVAGRGFFTSAISMLPLFLLAIEIPLTLWFTRHLCGCRRSKLIGGSPKELNSVRNCHKGALNAGAQD